MMEYTSPVDYLTFSYLHNDMMGGVMFLGLYLVVLGKTMFTQNLMGERM